MLRESQDANASIISFFAPAVGFLGRWLPLFFVPSLVVLPISLAALGVENSVKMMLVSRESNETTNIYIYIDG